MAVGNGFDIMNSEKTPYFLYIGETKIDHHLVERIERGNDIELHVRCNNVIFERDKRIFFGLGRDSFQSFYLKTIQYIITDDYYSIEGEFDKCVCFPKSFLKEYCKYINIELYRDGKHSFIMSDSDYQYYKQCLENKEISKCKHNYKFNGVWKCYAPNGYINNKSEGWMPIGSSNNPCDLNCDCCKIYQKEHNIKNNEKLIEKRNTKDNCPFGYCEDDKYFCKINESTGALNPCIGWKNCHTYIKESDKMNKTLENMTAKEAVSKIIEENCNYIITEERVPLNVEEYKCQCGYIEYGNIPNFCAKCGQRFKAPTPPFELTKPMLIDLDPVEVKQFKELDGFGLQDKLMMKRCAKCDSSHDFDWKDTKKFKCSEYKDYLIDVNLAKTKQCLCYNSKNRKVCLKCNHAFDAYSKGNTYKSEKECPFCHQYYYKQYRETHFSLGATLFTLIMWAIPIILAVFVNIAALITYTITLCLWGFTIGDCEGLGVFTTYEDKTKWEIKE